MEVADREQVGLAFGEPGACGGTLAPGAVPVAAAIVGDAAVAVVLAGFYMAAERRGAAGLDGGHHLELSQAQMTGVRGTVCGAEPPEDVRHLQWRAHRVSRRVLPSPR